MKIGRLLLRLAWIVPLVAVLVVVGVATMRTGRSGSLTAVLERAWKTYRDKGLLVIGVNIQDLEADARRFVAEVGITYPNVRDRDGKANRAYGITGIPETFFVSPDGRIIKKFPGAVVEWRLWEEAIAQLLASGPGE